MDKIKIKVAKFTAKPDNVKLGWVFRMDVLEPALDTAAKDSATVEVDMDGIQYGYPTSFLRGAFGGLVQDYDLGTLRRMLKIVSYQEPMLAEEIFRYIQGDKPSKATAPEKPAENAVTEGVTSILGRYSRALAQIAAARSYLGEYANTMTMDANTIRMLSLKVNADGRLTNLGGTLVGPGLRDHEKLVDYYRMLQNSTRTADDALKELKAAGVDLSLLRKPQTGDLPSDED